jgi:hypothetical protein
MAGRHADGGDAGRKLPCGSRWGSPQPCRIPDLAARLASPVRRIVHEFARRQEAMGSAERALLRSSHGLVARRFIDSHRFPSRYADLCVKRGAAACARQPWIALKALMRDARRRAETQESGRDEPTSEYEEAQGNSAIAIAPRRRLSARPRRSVGQHRADGRLHRTVLSRRSEYAPGGAERLALARVVSRRARATSGGASARQPRCGDQWYAIPLSPV